MCPRTKHSATDIAIWLVDCWNDVLAAVAFFVTCFFFSCSVAMLLSKFCFSE